jgi:subtilisin family serine protease
MKRSRRTLAGLVAAGVVIAGGALVATPAVPAAASPQPAAPGGAPRAEATSPSHTVVLLTGDRVTLTTNADGRTVYSVDPADDPGRRPVFSAYGTGDDLFVVPSDAAPYVDTGVLDRELFNVRELVREGFADGAAALPVIVTYRGEPAASALARSADALPATETVRALPSIDGAALTVRTDAADEFWDAMTAGGTAAAPAPPAVARSQPSPGALGRTVEKVWLDRKSKVDLDQSVPLIGAPEAWAAGFTGRGITIGVVDSGIDAGHPDLAGRIAESANFTGEPDATDTHGHGTHVASIIAGSGAASGGRYRGVAPDATLAISKVIDASGFGQVSWLIEGMEWAAARAPVVSMSVTVQMETDGTDPASLAADNLSDQFGTLFVVAAGNNSGSLAVGAPAAATSALAVAAVDKQDALAPYSNGGPRNGDAAVKPEIAAPGSDIVAARAAGTSLGTVVDDRYTTLSGTSMATPHVSGSAVLLKQAHPDWTATDLRNALVSTTRPGDYAWWQGGTGRVDVARAITQQVRSTGTVNIGRFAFPQSGLAPETAGITYTNDAATPVTLTLDADIDDFSGDPAPAGAASLSANTVTVPANGTATVNLTVDPTVGPTGVYGGVVRATSADGAVRVSTAVSWYKESETYPLTVNVRDAGGDPARPQTVIANRIDRLNPNDPFGRIQYSTGSAFDTGVATMRVTAGVYDVFSAVTEQFAARRRVTFALVPEVAMDRPRTVTLDASKGVNVRPPTPDLTDMPAATFGLSRVLEDGQNLPFSVIAGGGGSFETYATPSPKAKRGILNFGNQWALSEALVDLRWGGSRLHPDYDTFSASALLGGERKLPLVDGGLGSPEELANARGKAVLVRVPIPDDIEWFEELAYLVQTGQRIRDNAVAAGASLVLPYVDRPGAPGIQGFWVQSAGDTLSMSLPQAEGDRLRRELAQRPVHLDLTGKPNPSYVYHLRRTYDQIPAEAERPVNTAEMVRLDARYHADNPGLRYESIWAAFGPNDDSSFQTNWPWPAPTERVEYVGEPGLDVKWSRIIFQFGQRPDGSVEVLVGSADDYFLRGQHRPDEDWFASPVHIGAVDVTRPNFREHTCAFCRDGDIFIAGLDWLDSTRGHYADSAAASTVWKMSKDGVAIQPVPESPRRFPLAAGPGTYRLDEETTQLGLGSVRTLAPKVTSTWTLSSRRPPQGTPDGYACIYNTAACAFQPVIQADYDLNLDLFNRAPAGRAHLIDLTAYHHSGVAAAPAITGLDVWTSTDGGKTWTRAVALPRGGGHYTAIVGHPRLADTDGFVSLRLAVRDAAGGTMTTTVERAYALR